MSHSFLGIRFENILRASRAPHGRPRAPREQPRAAQERPKSGQERPKSGQEKHNLLSFDGFNAVSFEGVANARMTLSIDRPGKGIERGLRTRIARGRTGPDGRERRASLASKSATGTLPMQRAARPPRAFTHIFPTQNCIFSQHHPFSP